MSALPPIGRSSSSTFGASNNISNSKSPPPSRGSVSQHQHQHHHRAVTPMFPIDEDLDMSGRLSDARQLLSKRLSYGRSLRENKDAYLRGTRRVVTDKPHPSTGTCRFKLPPPVLDYSFMNLDEPIDIAATAPRKGRKKANVRQLRRLEERRKEDDEKRSQLDSNAALDFGRPQDSDFVLIRQGDVSYAFDRKKSLKLPEELIRGNIALFNKYKGKEVIPSRFEAHHCNLSNNDFTSLGKEMLFTLANIITVQLVILDLSNCKLRSIERDFLDIPEEHLKQLMILEGDRFDTGLDEEKHKMSLKKKLNERQNPGAELVLESLSTLYLHGNDIQGTAHILRLAPLANTLQFLTIHGNPKIDQELANPKLKAKTKILSTFTKLVSLNFTTLTMDDAEK